MIANDRTDMLRRMMLIRAFESALSVRKDHGFQLLSSGEEAVAVGLCSALNDDDQLLTGGRSIGPALARGLEPKRVMAELLGKSSGTNRGKGGRGHLADPAAGFFGAHAVVGGNISIAAGVALSRQMSSSNGIVAILFGDGAFGAGGLHEALNIASIWKLPLLFVCNNNQLSVSTPRSAALAPKKLSDIGVAFGMPSQTIDGMDVDVVANAMREAVEKVRAGQGPAFIECISFRFASHSTTARETRSRAELAAIRQRCPIVLQAAALKAAGILNAEIEADLDREVSEMVAGALAFADASEYPGTAEVLTDVW
jgi:TPP-dependent pyruvate/acetoin dehydrogenase alpha subunit